MTILAPSATFRLFNCGIPRLESAFYRSLIALDDFGTGYATLSQLLSFRLDKIKIDRSFVSHLGDRSDSRVIVRAILGLAKGFGLTTTAEGVEDEGQLVYLVANGCTEGQGYLFSGAVSAAGIPALLDREAGRGAVTEDGQEAYMRQPTH
ncbi:EAL domain-containing protein [Bradyrhizobium sp. USDA 3315]